MSKTIFVVDNSLLTGRDNYNLLGLDPAVLFNASIQPDIAGEMCVIVHKAGGASPPVMPLRVTPFIALGAALKDFTS